MMAPLHQEFEFLKKTGRAASFGSLEGRYPFFTSSQKLTKRTDVADCEGPALVFGTGGAASLHYVEGLFSATNDCYVVIPKSGRAEDGKFFYHYLRANLDLIESGFRGAGLKHVSKKHLEAIKLPVNPDTDRIKICNLLDKADGIRRKHQQVIQLADEFLRSVFLDMFGDPITNRKKWPIQKGRDVFGVLQYGTSSKSEDIQSSGSMPVLRIPNVVNGAVSLEGTKYGKFTSADEERLQLQCGDLLFVRTNGNPDHIARCAIFQLKGKYAFASYLIRGRIADEAGFNPEFIHALVSSSSYRKFLVRETRTTAGNFNISAGGIRNLPFIQPPLELQNGYLTIRQRVYAMHKRYGESSAIADNSFQSLSQRAFRGEL